MNGIVKFFDRNRGFGMITVENNPVDYFVHRKGIFGQDDENKGSYLWKKSNKFQYIFKKLIWVDRKALLNERRTRGIRFV